MLDSLFSSICVLATCAVINCASFICGPLPQPTVVEAIPVTVEETVVHRDLEPVYGTVNIANADTMVKVEEPVVESTTDISEEDIELLALVTMAEAEGECEEGKRLVIDTILNRVDSEHFPDTISEVIYQRNQFSSMWNGRVDRCYVQEEIVQLVREELENRTNYDVIFFHAKKYSKYGTPLFNVENHYFSSYD